MIIMWSVEWLLVDGGIQQGKTNIHIVGDVKKVGNLKTAIWEAYDLAFSL